MKKAILSSMLILSSTTIFAETTMCFKENASMTTIESTPLNGGACNGKYTVNDMKAKGWNVDDIKISQSANGMNFIYVLKTANSSTQIVSPVAVGGSQADMEARILEKLEKPQAAAEPAHAAQKKKEEKNNEKQIKTNKCQKQHIIVQDL